MDIRPIRIGARGSVGCSEEMLISEGRRGLPDERLEERHLRLLRAIDEVARRSAAGVSTMYQAAEKVGLDAVGKKADREEFMELAGELKEVGYVAVQGITYMGLRASYSVTDEGHRRLDEEGGGAGGHT